MSIRQSGKEIARAGGAGFIVVGVVSLQRAIRLPCGGETLLPANQDRISSGKRQGGAEQVTDLHVTSSLAVRPSGDCAISLKRPARDGP